MKRHGLAFVSLFLLLNTAIADRLIVQIGGGNKIDNSQGQIEDNVSWLSNILRRSSNNVVTFFAAGNSTEKDVALYRERDVADKMEPLARVFEGTNVSRLLFKPNDVPALSGSTRKDEITTKLTEIFGTLTPEQDVLLVYNGHGANNEEDVRLNTIKIWGDEKLNVEEVDAILDAAPDSTTVRFVFPQCFSGGFYNLIFDSPTSEEISKQNRCGFFAESAYEESEGCSLDTNKDEYRDYSTYFFAPLNGSTRSGGPLPLQADFDHDGIVSFRESHLYTLMVGESKDLSRASSEVYLENWTPWYLRWEFGGEDKNSVYWNIAEYLSRKHGLDTDPHILHRRKQELQLKIEKNKDRQNQHKEDIKRLAGKVKIALIKKWPELLHPYTEAYIRLINERIADISSSVSKMPVYGELAATQDDLSNLQAKELGLEREKTQIDKILRMKKLARLEKQFKRFASAREKRIYARLLNCEEGPFFRPRTEAETPREE